jgi:uncharacterized iron-regulated membrane protein
MKAIATASLSAAPPPPPAASALYRAVWRWHFFAGIFVAPFAIFLAITGGLYLWKPQFEEWRYRDLFNVPVAGAPLSLDAQFAAARGGEKLSVYVNPYTGAVVGSLREASRPMTIIHDLHGTLLAGLPGQLVIELVASWAFVLIVTGFYLWWPRPFTVRGFLLPRFGAGRRALLRDFHAVPAVWLSVLTLFLLSTGIQWTAVGGKWSRTLAQFVGEWQPKETSASAHRSELLGGWSPFLKDKALAEKVAAVASNAPIDDPHAEHRRQAAAAALRDDPEHPRISLSRVMAIAAERKVTDAYAIAFPSGPTGVYSIISDRNRAFTRAYVHVDQYSGKVLADVRYDDFGRMAKFYTFGIIAHEGQLFGLLNQMVGLVTCLGVITLAATGLAMWWTRRPAGKLAAPASPAGFTRPKAVVVIALALSALLPLMAASLMVLLLAEAIFGFLLERATLA